MPAYVSTYSAKQREILFSYAIDSETPIKQVLKDAREGKLEGLTHDEQLSLGAISYAYACQLVKEERHERGGVAAARKSPDRVARNLAAMLLRRAEADVRLLTEKRKKEPMKADDQRLAAAALKTAREAMSFLAELEKTRGNGAKPSSPAPAKPSGLAAQIAASASTAADDLPTQESASGERQAPRDDETKGATDGGGEGPARLRAAAP